MMRKAIVTALALLPTVVLAQDAPAQKSPDFAKLDRNGDGFVSREEVQSDPRAVKFFGQADMNHDGKLNEDEWLKARSMADRQKAGEYIDDSALTAKVKSALLAKKGVPSAEVTVETYHGIVQLSGFVDSAEQVRLAGETARGVKGVKEVRNSLGIKPKP